MRFDADKDGRVFAEKENEVEMLGRLDCRRWDSDPSTSGIPAQTTLISAPPTSRSSTSVDSPSISGFLTSISGFLTQTSISVDSPSISVVEASRRAPKRGEKQSRRAEEIEDASLLGKIKEDKVGMGNI